MKNPSESLFRSPRCAVAGGNGRSDSDGINAAGEILFRVEIRHGIGRDFDLGLGLRQSSSSAILRACVLAILRAGLEGRLWLDLRLGLLELRLGLGLSLRTIELSQGAFELFELLVESVNLFVNLAQSLPAGRALAAGISRQGG